MSNKEKKTKSKKAPVKKATIKEVAALAGVSIKTVSRVVNKEGNLRDTTRDKVLKAIQKLHYTPNLSARGLAGHHSFLFALLYDNPSANYILNVQEGVLQICRNEGFDLLIHPCKAGPTLADEIIKMIENNRVAGLILTPPLSDNAQLVKRLQKINFPFVAIAPAQSKTIKNNSEISNVYCDDREAAFTMTQHLLSLGHTRIGFIKGHPDHSVSQERYLGYEQAHTDLGLKIKKQLVVQGFFDFESGKKCARTLLKLENPPSAIFASNDDMAAGVLFVAAENKQQVPEQLSVVGFDDSPLAKQLWPTLSTIQQPVTEMASSACQLLIRNIRSANQSTTPQVTTSFSCILKHRRSTLARN